MEILYEYFFGSALGMWELLATILLIANVYLLARQKLINYWFGLAGVLIFGYIFYEFNLYSDMLLQWVFYAPLQIVGYFMWKYGKTLGGAATAEVDSMRISVLNRSYRYLIAAVILFATAMLGWFMSTTDASFPYADALTTVMSVVASILLLKKIWENWIIWIVMDLIAIPIYFMKELYITSGLYVVFLCLAIYGLKTWNQERLKNG